jgi:hypothetical protein
MYVVSSGRYPQRPEVSIGMILERLSSLILSLLYSSFKMFLSRDILQPTIRRITKLITRWLRRVRVARIELLAKPRPPRAVDATSLLLSSSTRETESTTYLFAARALAHHNYTH